jgi:DNA invertase Pin-like site-specific DNA recombinase
MTPTAHSYIRFSGKRQERGDSIRRQTEGARDWAERNKVTLDTSLRIDKGISAYRGLNADIGALGAFLKMVERGRVHRGDYLVVESLDRLTRQDIQPALLLILNLLQAGVRIVQLTPVEMVYDDKSEAHAIMLMVVELMRGNSESATKSKRCGDAWANKRQAARDGKDQPPRRKDGRVTPVITGRLPAWVEEKGGKLVLVPKRARVVKRIFALAAEGEGMRSIVARLTKDNVPPMGKGKEWTLAYVSAILKDGRALGSLQMTRGRGKAKVKDGDPLEDYYPAAVTKAEYEAARVAIRRRRTVTGRPGKACINIFAGLLKHARDGDVYQMTQRQTRWQGKGRVFQILVNAKAKVRQARMYSLPYEVFESAILSQLREVDPRTVLDEENDPDEEVSAIRTELRGIKADLVELGAALDRKVTATLLAAAERKEDRKAALEARLAEVEDRAEHPLSAVWSELPSLLAVLENAPDKREARVRLRDAVRDIVASMHLLVVPRGEVRLFAVQVFFSGARKGESRSYLGLHRPASGRGPGRWWCRSLAAVAGPGDLDLRTPDDVPDLEAALLSLDLSGLQPPVPE